MSGLRPDYTEFDGDGTELDDEPPRFSWNALIVVVVLIAIGMWALS